MAKKSVKSVEVTIRRRTEKSTENKDFYANRADTYDDIEKTKRQENLKTKN